MKNKLLKAAKAIYRAIPVVGVRKFCYDCFCKVMRGRRVIALHCGIKYELDLSETIDMALYLNQYEPDVTQAIQKYCRKDCVVLDIGANIGAHALVAAQQVGLNGQVFAFEPTQYAYDKLLRNIALNGHMNIKPLRLALANINMPSQKINCRSSWLIDGTKRNVECSVDFVKLDDWPEAATMRRLDVIKLDVDGNEYDVIAGGIRLLRKWHPIIIMEVWGPNFKDPNHNPFQLLLDLGYSFYALETNSKFTSLSDMQKVVSKKDGTLNDYSFNIIASI